MGSVPTARSRFSTQFRWFVPRLVVAAAMGTMVLANAWLEWSFGVLGGTVVGGVMMCVFATGIVAPIWAALTQRRGRLLVGASSLLMFVSTIIVVREVSLRRKAESMRRGDTIAAALASYQEDHGRYPDSLPGLVPMYLTQIPTSTMAAFSGLPFRYSRDADQGYALSFATPNYVACYRDKSSTWACHD